MSAVDSEGRTIWIADVHRGDGKRYIVRADEKLTAFVELARAVVPSVDYGTGGPLSHCKCYGAQTAPEADAALIEKWLGHFRLGPEIHSYSVRAGLCASFTHVIDEASWAGGTGGVVIRTIIRYCRNHIPIAVDVDVG